MRGVNMTGLETPYDRQINHKTMRQVIGALAILLAHVVYWLADVDYEVNSISATYWTNSGDLFVGALVVVGFFLAAYNGLNGRDAEFYISKFAALFAICVALFPTLPDCNKDVLTQGEKCPPASAPKWVESLTGLFDIEPYRVHMGSAVLLFVCLFVMLWFFSKRAASKNRPTRALLYRALAILMISGMPIIYYWVAVVKSQSDALYWIEVWGLTAFGVGWFIAGSYKNTVENDGMSVAN